MLESSTQQNENVSPALEAALWSLTERVSLTPEEWERFFILLMEYADVFTLNNEGLDRINILQHEIHTGDYPAIGQQFFTFLPHISPRSWVLLWERSPDSQCTRDGEGKQSAQQTETNSPNSRLEQWE